MYCIGSLILLCLIWLSLGEARGFKSVDSKHNNVPYNLAEMAQKWLEEENKKLELLI